MLSTSVENLKGFATTRPPLVVFMVCMGLFATVLLTLAYYVGTHEIRDPDISQDWNVFLKNFAELELCIKGNNSEQFSTQATTISKSLSKISPNTTPVSLARDSTIGQVLEYEGPRNYSVSLLLTIYPTRDFLSIPHNVTYLAGTIIGSQLGLAGLAADEAINITAELPYEWNTTHCRNPPFGCEPVQIYTCVHFQAAPLVFPTSRSPSMCEGLNETGIEYHARLFGYRHSKAHSTYYCRSHPTIKVNYKFNPTLAVWLSLNDRSVINLHLMNTSYFLFVMVVTLFCYAMLKGKPKNKLAKISDGIYF